MYLKTSKYVISVLLLFFFLAAAHGQEFSVEEIVSKHVDSIGSKEKIASIQDRLALGTSAFESKLPSKKTTGRAVIASMPGNLMFLASFMSEEYPLEKIGLFSDKIDLPWVTSGTRSPLGAFIADHEKILSTGLFTGCISSVWTPLDTQSKHGKFQSAGTKKLDGKKVYVLDYFPKGAGSGEFSIKVYFDAETFRHIRTEYRHQIASGTDTFGQLGRQAGVKIAMTENFGDYKTVDGLTLPHSYQISYVTDSNSGVYEFNWGVKIEQYQFNQKLTPDFFTFEKKRPA